MLYRFQVEATKRKTGRRPPILADIAGFLIYAWGGSITVNLLLGLPPVQLLSPDPLIAYVAIHLFITAIFSFVHIPSNLSNALAIPFAITDALTRSATISATVRLVQAHSNPLLTNSVFAQVVLGAISATAGGQIGGMLSVSEPEWRLQTPPALRKLELLATLDMWSAALFAFAYGFLTAVSPAYAGLYHKLMGKQAATLIKPDGARALLALCLFGLYLFRIVFNGFDWSATKGGRSLKVASSHVLGSAAQDSAVQEAIASQESTVRDARARKYDRSARKNQ